MMNVLLTYLILAITSCVADQTINISCQSDTNIKPAFHASMIRQPYTFSKVNEIIKFEHVWTNIGDAYHPNTGVFIVPRDGLYQIMGTLWSTSGRECSAALYKNYSVLNYVYARAVQGESSTAHALVELRKGDRIYFKNRHTKENHCFGNYHSEFSGWFVRE